MPGYLSYCHRPPPQNTLYFSPCSSRVSANYSTQQTSSSKPTKLSSKKSAASSPKSSSKPPKLLRTWKEGRRIPSNPKPQKTSGTVGKGVQEEKSEDPLVLDNFYLHTGHHENEVDVGEANDTYEDDDDAPAEASDNDAYDIDDGDAAHRYRAQQESGISTHHQLASNSSSCADLNCQHFSRCSGCVLETALDQPPVFNEAKHYFSSHGVHDLNLTTGSVWEWRCKAKLAIRGTSTNPVVGLYVEGTHDVVDIPNCRTHHPKINAAIELLKEGIRTLGVQPYHEDLGTGELRYVQLSVTTYNTSIPTEDRYLNGRVQVALVWNARSEQSSMGNVLTSLAQFLWQKGGAQSASPLIHSVWANFQTSHTNVIFGGRWRHLFGERQCWERIGGVDISLIPASFSQANLQAFESLLRKLQRFVKPGKAVVEFYAGSGIIGLSLAATGKCRAVRCVEVNKEAAVPFELALSRLPSSIKSKISWHGADVTVSPINWLKGFDVVVLDPPRKGLDMPVIEALRTASFRGQGRSKPPSEKKLEKIEKRPWIIRAKQSSAQIGGSLEEDESTWPDTLIYISCGWDAFKADCMDLVKDGAWHLLAGHAFNFFPGTDSIEVLAVFKRGKKVKAKKKILKKKKSKWLGRGAKHSPDSNARPALIRD